MKEFCPKCGATIGPFFKGFCKKCFLEDHELISVPETIEIERCTECGKIRLFGKWVDWSEKNLGEFFERKARVKELLNPRMKIELNRKSPSEYDARIIGIGEISGQKIEAEKGILLKFNDVKCVSCGKLSSGYFEAKIQLRWNAERDSKKEKKVYFELKNALKAQRALNSLAVITKREALPNGLDLYIGSNKAARSALSRIKKKYRAKIVPSKKLVGSTSNGRNKFRFTYSVRF